MANGSFFGMDPRDEWNTSTWELFRCCLVRTLTSYDVSGSSIAAQPVPDLASGPPEVSSDGLTWTFHLRPGLHYAPPMQDTEITAPDFARALRRLAEAYDPGQPGLAFYLSQIDGWNEFASGKASSIVGLQTPDPLTLRIVQTRPDASLPYVLALPLAAPIPPSPGSPDAAEGVATGHDGGSFSNENSYGRFLVASGPYMFEGSEKLDPSAAPEDQAPVSGLDPWTWDDKGGCCSLVHTGSMTLVRNPSWHPEDDPLRLALADTITIEGGEGDRLFEEMASGSLDLVFDGQPPPSTLGDYRADPQLRPLIAGAPGASVITVAFFNIAMPPFDDVWMRRAVAFALDRSVFPPLAEASNGGIATVAQHFSSDPLEGSLLSGWSGIPGQDGVSDVAAAREALARSAYARGGRCVDPVCRHVPVIVGSVYRAAVGEIRHALAAVGIDADITVDEEAGAWVCADPEAHVAMCVGGGWSPDFPSAANYIGAFFRSDGGGAATRTGASSADLSAWGYDVTRVPTVDDRVDRCAQEVGATQPACWARLDQYIVTQLMPAIPLVAISELRISSPSIGPIVWDGVYSQPALDRMPAPRA